MKYLAIALVAISCAGSDRTACYAEHDEAAAARVERECFARGHTWDDCPTREAILDALEKSYRSCR